MCAGSCGGVLCCAVLCCVQVRGPHIVQQYHRLEQQTVDKDRWFDTGTVLAAALLH
jgi:hypothetical protein